MTTPKQKAQFATDADATARDLSRGRVLAMNAAKRLRARQDTSAVLADLDQANASLATAQETFYRLTGGLGSAGLLMKPEGEQKPSTVPPIPLDMLDTPDTRELLATLERAQQIAERIDAQRGRTVGDAIPLQPGESAGTDLAESVSLLALRIRQEVHGARSPHE